MLQSNTYFNPKWLIVAVTFTATVVFLTHIPQEAMPSQLQVNGLDKLVHTLAYGVITFLFILSLRTSPRLLSASLLFFAILGIGAIDELYAAFCAPNREFSRLAGQRYGHCRRPALFHLV